MQKGIDSYIKEQFGISEVDIRTYSPLTLAYIGDPVCCRRKRKHESRRTS